ncbi:selenoprotein L isoform X4 [Hypanus sabinus]|uniref:selenoprotein L isoform X4 n=1 Tax=Hypanus sabinus TaxID=79690 RepID=UPI0028C381E1|nr:selenoprotein L isoform X4 [Hypanus sabinus]
MEELLRALEDLLQGGRRILAAAREESAGENVQEFVSQKIGCLAELIRLYANFFNSLHVQKRSDTEDLFKRFYHSVSVQDQVEDLLEFEAEWNNFLGDMDDRLKAHSFQAQLTMGTQVPGSLVFTDVRTEREVQLGEFLQDEKKLLLVLLRHFA